MNRLLLVSLLGATVASTGCNPEESSECLELESWLDNRARELDRDCSQNSDCSVVWLRPDSPSAASAFVEDPAVRRVRREFSQNCSANLYGSGAEFIPPSESDGLTAICQPQLEDQQQPDGSIVEVEVGRLCVLSGEITPAPRVDAGVEDVNPPDTCACGSNADCGGGQCVGCSCVAAGDCATICAQTFECQLQDELNTGSTGAACVASCEARSELDPTVVPLLASCARSSSCESLNDCF